MAEHEHLPSRLFLHGKPIPEYIENHEHISPLSAYVKVLSALFVLTAITYGVSFADLGPASLWVALGVAFVKATLVCMFFMHLKYDDRYHVFVFLSSLLFVGIFFTFTIFDIVSRPRLNEQQDTFFRIDRDADWDERQNLATPPADEVPPAQGDPAAAGEGPESLPDTGPAGDTPGGSGEGQAGVPQP